MRDIPGAELRAGRTLAGLTIAQLADSSGLSVPTIQRAETSRVLAETVTQIVAALERHGVEFLTDGGVRLVSATQPAAVAPRQFTGKALHEARRRSGLYLHQLAEEAGVSVGTLKRMEAQDIVSGRPDTVQAVVDALARYGVRIVKLPIGDGGP